MARNAKESGSANGGQCQEESGQLAPCGVFPKGILIGFTKLEFREFAFMSGLLLFLGHTDDAVGCSWENPFKVFEVLGRWQGATELMENSFSMDGCDGG